MRGAVPSLVAALLAVAGCQVGPAYRQPAVPVPQGWDNASPDGGQGLPDADWWAAFGSPQLDSLMRRARSGNLDIAAAAARIEEADAQAREAGAPLLPSLGTSSNDGAARQLNLTGRERHRIFFGGVLQASYQVDFWGKNRSALQAAQATASAARFAWQVVALSTQASVATTYFGYLGLQRQVAIVADDLRRQRDLLSGLSEMQRSGVIPRLGVTQQQTVVDALAASLPPLAQQAEQMRTALAILVGVLPEELRLQPEALSGLKRPVISAGLPSQLLLRRPDVQGAEATLRAANANIRVARAAFFPSLDLNASGGIASYALTHATVPPLGIYSLAAGLTQPIFEGGLLRGQLDYAKAVYGEDVDSYRKTALSAFGDVENALTAVRQTSEAASAQSDGLQSARLGAGMAQDAFHGGTTTILDVLTAEGALVAAEESSAQADVARLQALVGLYGALGGGWSGQDGGRL